MILVTIGSLFPFDRLVRLTDELALSYPNETFFAQIGDGEYRPKNMQYARMLSVTDFNAAVKSARLIVAHAGMGSVITAMEANKPIVIVPRNMELREHTTDHQVATARWLEGRPGILVAFEDSDLAPAVHQALSADYSAKNVLSPLAPKEFVDRIRDYIASV